MPGARIGRYLMALVAAFVILSLLLTALPGAGFR